MQEQKTVQENTELSFIEFKKTVLNDYRIGRISREARQRQVGIWVLQATAMPTILVETGYITNPEEDEYLNSVDGQQEICNAIAQAVAHYKTALETNSFRNIVENTQ